MIWLRTSFGREGGLMCLLCRLCNLCPEIQASFQAASELRTQTHRFLQAMCIPL